MDVPINDGISLFFIPLTFPVQPKGQLISKCPFGVFKSPKKQRYFSRISALASKNRPYHFLPLIGEFYMDPLTLLF